MDKILDYIVYIGRFQPPHLAHIEIVERGLTLAKNVIVLIGSANQPRTHKNPFTWQEREEMILMSLPKESASRVFAHPLHDKGDDELWVKQVQEIMCGYDYDDGRTPTIGLIGHSKDSTSYYLNMFPQWEQIDVENIEDIHASDIRHAFLTLDEDEFYNTVGNKLPAGVYDYLNAFTMRDEYEQLCREYEFNNNYKRAYNWDATLDAFLEEHINTNWGTKEQISNVQAAIEVLRNNYKMAPYSPNFYCADAVVVQSGHVLLIRRRSEPGKGLWAVPGGHINQREESLPAAIRELREETKLKVPANVLAGSLHKDRPSKVFEKPERSLRGRTISYAYYFVLRDGTLPKVKGTDDADKARWVPLSTFDKMEDQMFEDHYRIVKYFTG